MPADHASNIDLFFGGVIFIHDNKTTSKEK